MANVPSESSGLTEAQKKELLTSLLEVQARGGSVLDILKPGMERNNTVDWRTNKYGYFKKENGTEFIPNSFNQKSFIESTARFCAFVGGRGSGKSGAGSQKALRKIKQGESGLIINPQFEMLKISTWPEFREWLPWDMVIPRHRHMQETGWVPSGPFSIVFRNNAKVTLKGLHNVESARGPNVNWFWYDEGGSDLDGMAWTLAIASVRVGEMPQAWVTTTPRGKSHWLYRFFVEQNIPEDAIEAFEQSGEDRALIEYYFNTIENNKDNLDPSFFASMLSSYTGHMRSQELEGQFVDEGMALGSETWFKNRIIPNIRPDDVKKAIRYWDLAASEKKIASTKKKSTNPDFTCGGKLVQRIDDSYVIESIVRGQLRWMEIKELIVTTAQADGPAVEIWIEEEPGAGGKNQVAAIAAIPELAGFTVRGHNPRDDGDKIIRANHWYAKSEMGLVSLVYGTWNREFLDQFSAFPLVDHDDIIDCISGAFICLSPLKKKWGKPQYMSISLSSTPTIIVNREEKEKVTSDG